MSCNDDGDGDDDDDGGVSDAEHHMECDYCADSI